MISYEEDRVTLAKFNAEDKNKLTLCSTACVFNLYGIYFLISFESVYCF